jgi:alpha-methylacyl-CoA racemase
VFFSNLCRALELDQYAHHQFEDKMQDEIRAAFRAAFAERDRDDWVAELAPLDTCVAPVLAIDEVPSHPQLVARGLLAEAEHPDHGRFKQLGPLIAGHDAARSAES